MIDLKKKYRIPAMIDGKDVTTDWIESIFDSEFLSRDCRMVAGFINHCVVTCMWDSNTFTWQVSKDLGRGNVITAYMLLEERLKSAESDEQNVYSMIQHGELGKLQLVQKFYFKED